MQVRLIFSEVTEVHSMGVNTFFMGDRLKVKLQHVHTMDFLCVHFFFFFGGGGGGIT